MKTVRDLLMKSNTLTLTALSNSMTVHKFLVFLIVSKDSFEEDICDRVVSVYENDEEFIHE